MLTSITQTGLEVTKWVISFTEMNSSKMIRKQNKDAFDDENRMIPINEWFSVFGKNASNIHPFIGTILCAERWCCLSSSLMGYWAQSWTGCHSDAGYSNGSIIPASWYSFCRPRKDDRLSKSHLVLIQQPSRIWTSDLLIPSPSP